MEEKEFLGKGMKFPPQINNASGRFVVSSGTIGIKESIYIILMTQKSERFTRPEFGSRILSYTFMDTSVTRLNMLGRELRETILEQEPRVDEVEVQVDSRQEAGCLIISIDYYVASSNTRENLVFPFYLNAQSGEDANAVLE